MAMDRTYWCAVHNTAARNEWRVVVAEMREAFEAAYNRDAHPALDADLGGLVGHPQTFHR